MPFFNPCWDKKSHKIFEKKQTIFPRLGNFITYFLVVVRLPFMMRVEVETDLKLPIPPPMLSIPSRPPMEEEKEEKSTEGGQMIRKRRGKKERLIHFDVSLRV